ncbi:Tyrosyl-tRNA synthetase [Forsythia ovata]|uniref:Tyrosine--tRNA ligase n=1 Tax=Forsythia ovata TaxID=205694 RepID=A0ABD1PVJ3_9LAMI
MAANSFVRSVLVSCNQRLPQSSSLYHFPILLRPRPTHRRHPYLWPLSLRYSSTQFVQESAQGDAEGERGRLNVVNILEERGLLESLTSDSLRSACSDPGLPALRVYCGFDPTAESLHLGNLLGIIVLSWFLRCGHKVVALVGGATGRVGDPSGKSLERPELDLLALDRNVSGISTTISRILGRNHGAKCFSILNNYDWWKDVKLLDFLKDVGKFARMGVMMSKESVRKRLESEQGMSYTEFTYQLLQGYDFLHLFREEEVSVQIGGSDQWGNITAGTDLIRRILQAEGAYGLTFPLLLKSDGTKFGKSEDGAIWLSPSLLSPYQFYQYLFSVPDSDVVRFLKILTFLSMEEIAQIERDMQGPGYVPNTAQRRLAEEVTLFVHGEEGLDEARKATEALRPGAETKLDWKIIEAIAEDVPSCSLPYDNVMNISLLDLSVSIGLLESKSAARRLLKQGGLYLNNSRVDSEAKKIEVDDIVDGKVILLSAGKKNKMIVMEETLTKRARNKQNLLMAKPQAKASNAERLAEPSAEP